MPTNDPGFWETAAAYFAVAFSAVTGWAWKHTHSLVKEKAEAAEVAALAADVKSKADQSFVNGVLARLENIFQNQRQDNQRIFEQIERITEHHNKFAEKAIEELGRRPTREECASKWRACERE